MLRGRSRKSHAPQRSPCISSSGLGAAPMSTTGACSEAAPWKKAAASLGGAAASRPHSATTQSYAAAPPAKQAAASARLDTEVTAREECGEVRVRGWQRQLNQGGVLRWQYSRCGCRARPEGPSCPETPARCCPPRDSSVHGSSPQYFSSGARRASPARPCSPASSTTSTCKPCIGSVIEVYVRMGAAAGPRRTWPQQSHFPLAFGKPPSIAITGSLRPSMADPGLLVCCEALPKHERDLLKQNVEAGTSLASPDTQWETAACTTEAAAFGPPWGQE